MWVQVSNEASLLKMLDGFRGLAGVPLDIASSNSVHNTLYALTRPGGKPWCPRSHAMWRAHQHHALCHGGELTLRLRLLGDAVCQARDFRLGPCVMRRDPSQTLSFRCVGRVPAVLLIALCPHTWQKNAALALTRCRVTCRMGA